MRGFVLGLAAALAVLGSQVAVAADLPVKAARPAAVVAANWTGFYVGGYMGGAFGTSKWVDTDPAGRLDASVKPSGFIGGGQLGYNYQINQLVLGIEGEGGWTNYKASTTQPPDACFPGSPPQSCITRASWLAMLTGRAGLAWERSLLYVKGGVAWSRFSYENPCPAVCSSPDFFAHETRTGWTIGGGIEYMLNHSWSAKLEYNYVDFGTGHPLFVGTNPGTGGIEDVTNRMHIVKVGVNYRFNTGEPIAARY